MNITKGSLSAANAELERAKTLVNKRNKLIRFADKSPASWTAVEEYESDELAEDSEDEKKLRGAEKRALAKIREKKRKNVSSPAQATTTRVSSTDVSAAGPAHVPVNPLPFCQSFRGRQTSASVAVKEVTGPTQRPALVVFAEPVQLPQATSLATDRKYEAALTRLGQDEYNLSQLFNSLGDFDPVDI